LLDSLLQEIFVKTMHVPLDPHLHTDECNEIISQLQKCHDEMSLFRQFFGACNQLDWAMRACTKKERLQATDENRRLSKERVKRIGRKVGEMDGKDWRDIIKEKEKEFESE